MPGASAQPDGSTGSECRPAVQAPATWYLRLFVAAGTPRSNLAHENLVSICEEYLPGRYLIEVVDVCVAPQVARDEGIVALPVVERRIPAGACRVVGTLSDRARVVAALGLT